MSERTAKELERTSTIVGKDGKTAHRASMAGAGGSWTRYTDSVNTLIDDLIHPTTEVGRVIEAVAKGDLTHKVALEIEGVPLKGQFLRIGKTVNTLVDRLDLFASEVTRVAREVGVEGKLGVQANVGGVSGTWKDLTDNVNLMVTNLTDQVRDIAKVSTAIAQGDLTNKITVDAKGEVLELKNTINTMVDKLSTFAEEVGRVAREVGTEGVLGGQAKVEGVTGTWRDLIESVNTMASNLTSQVRDIAEVTTAVANGDLSRKVTVEAKGEILELKNTINTMVDQLSSFASEVTRVAREVGEQGKLGAQADVRGVSGAWRDLTDTVNGLATNLTEQVRNIAEVITAVANGDFTKKVTVEVKGEVAELKNTINSLMDQLRSFSSEVARVAREVGTEGRLGAQADVEGVSGSWRELTDNVNMMASNLTEQVRNIAQVIMAVAKGDLSQKVTVEVKGEILELKNTINAMVDQLSTFASEVTRVAREVGSEGTLGGQATVQGVSGIWNDLTESVNLMLSNLTNQVRDIARVTTAVANGDLSKKITIEAKGEILDLKDVINAMVDQLSTFAAEVTRVAREVGKEGKLGGQAEVPGVSGTWKDLTDNVNTMASNLTSQVRGIVEIVTAIAKGDLSRKFLVEAKGEIAALAGTINGMVDMLNTFSDQVTLVAREVGTEGKLGAQAEVPDAEGSWRDLTDNVNTLANNLTNQVRAIAEVASAVTEGDLTRKVTVEARGEIAALTDNINSMITTLKETGQKNEEQDWLKSNLAKFTGMLQGQRNLREVASRLLTELAPVLSAQHGVFYMPNGEGDDGALKLLASYAYQERKNIASQFRPGEGLVGQCALEKQRILLTQVPGDYIRISSGLGEAVPLNIAVLPVLFEDKIKAVIELASFERFTPIQLSFLDQFTEGLGITLNAIQSSLRTDELLSESQTLSEELQTQQEELQQSNEELEEKARQMEEQTQEVEAKNRQVEEAKIALEEKAEQLALTSKYKSEFLANMSHELRTPLNSLLILSQQLADNTDENLTSKQVEFAQTIHSSGNDLLGLINEVLDLAKVESGTMAIDVAETRFASLQDFVGRAFNQVAKEKNLGFSVELDPDLPELIKTDTKRLQQVLRNLLSNAFKFTETGSVTLQIRAARKGWSIGHDKLDQAESVIAFSVTDTGIGIPVDRQKLVFEAFQQADGGTSRKYSGTGLGLSISREIASLLGGEIRVQSVPGEGSTFTLYLPQAHVGAPPRSRAGHPTAQAWKPAERAVESRSVELAPTEDDLMAAALPDDRDTIKPGDRVLLIIEDDEKFARILIDQAREKGFKALAALRGNAGFALARKFTPDAITLDLQLPDAHGWVVLDRLKHDPATRHIPVHIISVDEEQQRGLEYGAIAHLQKPLDPEALDVALTQIASFVERRVRNLLVVEDDETQRKAIVELIGNHDVATVAVESGEKALEALKAQKFDCMVLDLKLPGMSGIDLIKDIKKDPELIQLPIVVYTGKELTRKQETELRKLTDTIIVKDAKSPERLLDETALFLHRVEANLPEPKRQMLRKLHQSDPALEGKKVLIVDDDMRNIFAITSILERHKMQVLYSENGKEGIAMLEQAPDVDIVLMDIMMPEMDGYEAMRAIRERRHFAKLPIIALTAKAMKGDREKCIDAGASDYITKPIDTEQLLSLLRVWLYR